MSEYEIWQDGMPVAVAECEDEQQAAREALHYAAQYAQDGPVQIMRVIRMHCDPEHLAARARGFASVSDRSAEGGKTEGLDPEGESTAPQSGGRP